MPTAVNVHIVDDQPSPSPIASVVVQIYALSGTLVTTGTTDGNGIGSFSLPDGTYNLLFYKQGVSILPRQPQQIVVSALAASNTFLITGHVSAPPETTDPNRCRISGTLLGVDGLPVHDLRVSLRPCPDFSVVAGNLVSPQSQLDVHPTHEGHFQFDLLRGLHYQAYLLGIDTFPQLGIDPGRLLVIGPPYPSMSLANLLFPLPVLVQFSQDSISIPLAAGPDGSATLGTITYSDGSASGTDPSSRTQQPPFATLEYVYSDPTLFSIILSNGATQVTPYKTGTGTVTLTRRLPKSIFWPEPPTFASETLTVTIT